MKSTARIRKMGLVVLAFLLSLAVLSSSALAGERVERKKVVILIANALTWADIEQANAPFLKSLVNEYASANMSSRTVGRATSFIKGCATIGAGNRIDSSSSRSIKAGKESDFFEGEKVADEYFRRTGIRPSQGSIVNLDIATQITDNKDSAYNAIPGLLGKTLRDNGLKTCVIGNSDASFVESDKLLHREAVSVVMDDKGRVDFGEVGKEILLRDKQAPFGIRTNRQKVLESFGRFYPQSDIVVIDYGDTTRLDLFRRFSTEENWLRLKELTISQFDAFTRDLFAKIDKDNTILIIVSPSTSMDLTSPQQLNFLIAAGAGVGSGLLSSASTQRGGLVANVDIAPTILDYFDLAIPSEISGRPMSVVPFEGDRISFLVKFNDRALYMDKNQAYAVIFYIFIQIITFGLAITFLLQKMKKSANFFVATIILLVMSVPLSFYLSALFLESGLSLRFHWMVVAILALALSSVATVLSRFDRFLPVIFLTGSTAFWLTLDLLFLDGLTLVNTVGFGYSSIVAGRFYGMGNEAMSVFIVCSVLASVFVCDRFVRLLRLKRWVLLIVFIGATFVIGFPSIGANTGGTITAVVTYSFILWQMFVKKIKAVQVLAIVLSVVLLLGVFITADLMRPKNVRTHMGRSAELIGKEGISATIKIVQRKITTNWRVLRTSLWSLLVLVIIAILVFLSYYPIGSFEAIGNEHSLVMLGLKGVLIGSIVGFLTNDSGVVIPALMLSFVASLIFYLHLMDFTVLTLKPMVSRAKVGRNRGK